MTAQEILDLAATMNRMLVPDHHDGPWNVPQQMLQKDDDLLAAERDRVGLQMQLDPAFPRTHTYGTNQVEAVIVFDTRTNDGCSPARCPCPFERRHQRKATFIKKNERRAELLPLFLYAARCNVSSAQWTCHRGAVRAVAVSGNSTRDVA